MTSDDVLRLDDASHAMQVAERRTTTHRRTRVVGLVLGEVLAPLGAVGLEVGDGGGLVSSAVDGCEVEELNVTNLE